ncbi:MAG: FtsX-like permease family protein [Azospirillum sp.]|nr:FtsX-like permease family protein [Azospirillum sp.]
MTTLVIAWRNIFRNRRRSALTLLAIVVGAVAVLLFGGFVTSILFGLQTNTVRAIGHLQVFRQGYFEFGAGKPGAYGIKDYARVLRLIRDDAALQPLIRVLTPTLQVFGIAGNFAENTSRTFYGRALIPSDRLRMWAWDGLGIGNTSLRQLAMSDDDRDGGVIGVGLARILHECAALKVLNCTDGPSEADVSPDLPAEDFSSLIEIDPPASSGAAVDRRPKIDLLAATVAGAPNVVTLQLNGVERQGAKELDDNYVLMHLDLGQRLLYGRGEHQVTGLVIQLHHSSDVAGARRELRRLFAAQGLDLDVRDYTELNPFYLQVIAMFGAIFGFLAVIMGVIVLFTVVNTMSMSVMERTAEIGTIRALGLRRSGVRRLFLAEGLVLGVLSASLGLLVGLGLSFLVNRAGLTWTPPTSVDPVPLRVMVAGNPLLLAGCWFGLVALSALSSLLPANKAARLEVVDALRHG